MASLDSKTLPNLLSAEVDPTHAAARVSIRPLESVPAGYGGKMLGQYRVLSPQGGPYNLGQINTITSPQFFSNGVMAACRWTDPNNYVVINRVYGTWTYTGNPGAAGPQLLVRASGYSVFDTTNANIFFPSTNTKQAVRSNMPQSSFMQIAITTGMATAGAQGLAGGTRTLDNYAVGQGFLCHRGSNTGVGGQMTDFYKWDVWGGHPLVLGYNEGLLLFQSSMGSANTAVGVLQFGLEWAEVAGF